MNNRIFYQSALIGGVVSALIDSMPYIKLINALCCIGIIFGGIAAFAWYRYHFPEVEKFSLGELVHLSLVTGLIGAGMSFILHFIFFKILGNWEVGFIVNMMDNLEEIPPMWEDIYKDLTTGKYSGFAGPVILVQSLILFPIFNFIGVLIGNRFLGMSKLDDKNSQ